MIVIGLTGGIGSGKSTVALLFAERGVPIIDADVIARDLTQPDQPAFSAIINHFNKENLLKNGTLDRVKLRQIIFSDPHQRHWLQNLLHPLIRDEMERQIKTLTAPYCIAVIPLLVEAECYSFLDRILVVDTPEHLQIERVALRDQSEKSQIEAILKTQTSRHDRLTRAHDLITNDGVLADLAPQVDKLHRQYLKISGSR